MSYEWKFNPRPYSDEEAKKLLKNVMSPETTDWHYNTHHKGYVTFLNKIEAELEKADRSTANGNYSAIGELKRRLTWNHGGTVLHDLYWQVLGGDGDPSKGKEVVAAIVKRNSAVLMPGRRISRQLPSRPNSPVGVCWYLINFIAAAC